ncbi:ParM/StbA family protein [Alicyclobacillus sp. ALC3]|uniref:ParM/StbA family protein n=1 Tax=Alicyclobacillus sp. ALC3 TaxID=2796143 RepID=UPI002379BFAC|nr:ParM/StbA family protein [Alicyclobacillus sp. ALC3]WDL99800.1 ParM/StbA family protein [Alicyclobacillus sp. ALC3]
MLRLAAIDIGNDSVKPIYSGAHGQPIPNVIAPIPADRGVLSLESNVYEGIHCRITSPALANSGVYAVGNLATRYAPNHEPEPGDTKGTSDQAVIMLLVSLALDAATETKASPGTVHATYAVSTGLPLREAKQPGARAAFAERLMGKVHEVEFLQTPDLSGTVVRIEFEQVDVYSEGQAAMMHLVTDEHGHIKNTELLQKSILINDIGGLSTDSAVIERGEPDNINSEGINSGVSEYLDLIIENVYQRYHHKIRSRRNLVRDVLLAPNERKNHILVDGKLTSVKDIVDVALAECARVQHEHLTRMWKKVSDLELVYQIGGGSALLRPYLTAVNEQGKRTFPLRWQESSEESVWMIAESYWRMLQLSRSAASVSEGV